MGEADAGTGRLDEPRPAVRPVAAPTALNDGEALRRAAQEPPGAEPDQCVRGQEVVPVAGRPEGAGPVQFGTGQQLPYVPGLGQHRSGRPGQRETGRCGTRHQRLRRSTA
ncbi:hypothetical protein [Streptomyces avidinii]